MQEEHLLYVQHLRKSLILSLYLGSVISNA